MNMRKMDNGNYVCEDARIIFKNFSGKGTQFNPEGNRNFCLVLNSEAEADMLAREGYNVKHTNPKSPDDDICWYLPVALRFGNYPPKMYLVSGKNKLALTEDNVKELDMVEIEKYDIEIRPYHWEAVGKSGTKAYLKSLYATLREDPFAGKYDFTDDERVEQTEQETLPF